MKKLNQDGTKDNMVPFLSGLNSLLSKFRKKKKDKTKGMQFIILKEGEQILMERFFGTTEIYGVEGPGNFAYDPSFTKQIPISFLGKEIWVVRTSIPEQFTITSEKSGKVNASSGKGFTIEANVNLYIKINNIVLFEKYFGEEKTIGSTIVDQALRLAREAIIPKDIGEDMVEIPTDESIQKKLRKACSCIDSNRNLYWHKTDYGYYWAINVMDPDLDTVSKSRLAEGDRAKHGTKMLLKLKKEKISDEVQKDAIHSFFVGGKKGEGSQQIDLKTR